MCVQLDKYYSQWAQWWTLMTFLLHTTFALPEVIGYIFMFVQFSLHLCLNLSQNLHWKWKIFSQFTCKHVVGNTYFLLHGVTPPGVLSLSAHVGIGAKTSAVLAPWVVSVLTPGLAPWLVDSESSLVWLSAHCSGMYSLLASWERVWDVNFWGLACMKIDVVFSYIW